MKTKLKIISLLLFTVILQGMELKPNKFKKLKALGIEYRLKNENIKL
jgi:hypothetical protein